MTTIDDVTRYLDTAFHPEYQEDYDNAGFLVGRGSDEYRGALVALDLTDEVAQEARTQGLNLIVTHHPLIFGGVKRITDHTATGRLLLQLIGDGIAVYAAHTNLDNLKDGVNGILCRRLGLVRCRILKPFATDEELGAGMVGELPAAEEADAFLRRVKKTLHLPVVRTSQFPVADARLSVRRVAVCGGSGAFLIGDALAAGADIYLTADLKYHDFQRTTAQMILADIGHYESEQFAKEIICDTISKKFSNFAVRISERQQSIVRYM